MAQDIYSTEPNAPLAPVAGSEIDQFPVWTLWDVVKITIISIATLFFFSLLILMIATGLPMFKATSLKDLTTNAVLAVVSQLLAYAATFWFVYRLIARHYSVPFLDAIHWRWPKWWPGFLLGGIALSGLIQILSKHLPIPKQLPIDEFFRTPLAAWAMAIFGVLIAPFAEELFFRGLLFPVLKRRIGLTLSLVITALAFAFLHAAQLRLAWAPVLVLFIVGMILTMVRAFTHSLACSTLLHIGYNGTLFVLLYLASDGFHHLDKVMK